MNEIVNPKPLLITIGSHPTNSLNLDQELKLLKAAILYGDRVELYSLKASMFGLILKLKNTPASLQLHLLEEISPYFMQEFDNEEFHDKLQMYKHAITRRPVSTPILVVQRRIDQEWKKVVKFSEQMVLASGLQEIEKGIQAGVVSLHTFENARNQQQAIDFIADCIALASGSPLLQDRRSIMEVRTAPLLQEFVQGMISAVSDGSSLPLFDDKTSHLINAGVRAGVIIPSNSATTQAKHSALAADLLERIPRFEEASIDQVLEIRNALDRPLIRFRSALYTFSEKIKSAAWEKDFPSDADIVFRKDVAPAILDIEDATMSNKLVVTILRGLVEKSLSVPSGSAIGLAISRLSGLPEALTISIGASAAAGMVIFDAYKSWAEKNLHVQQNAMYFYYRAAKNMEKLPATRSNVG